MAVAHPRKIFITGGPGSGKTTLAQRLAVQLALPAHELDTVYLTVRNEPCQAVRYEQFATRFQATIKGIAATDAWLVEGAYLGGTEPLLRDADCIIWMDVPWRVASYRIIARHLKATLRGDNRFPGWRRFLRFWFLSRAYYLDRNPPGLNPYGAPDTRSTAIAFLAPYRHKLITSTQEDATAFLARIATFSSTTQEH